jgi:hypothetical protein
VRTVRVGHHGEELVMGDKFVDQGFKALVVDVVVRCSMTDQQITLKLVGKSDRRSITIALLVVLG